MNYFRKWCSKYNVYTNDSNICTHLLLDGGKLNIQSELMNSFIKIYIKSLYNNEEMYVVEKISSQIKLFIDIDSKSNIIDTTNVVNNILDIIKYNCQIYKCNHSNGYHLVFPTVILTPDEARAFVSNLRVKVANNLNILNIENIIDTSVYSTGLRMIGSYKVNQYRCYLPLNKTSNELVASDIYNSLIRASYDNSKSNLLSKQIRNENQYYIKLEQEISLINPKYSNITIRCIKFVHGHICISTNSKFCQNLNDYHSSASVYFVISKSKKISQKCFCRCTTTDNRSYGRCCDYKSKSFPFSHILYNMIAQNCT